MSRMMTVAVVVLLSAGVAWGQDQRGAIVSYYENLPDGGTWIASVPDGGFVMTDIVTPGGATVIVRENGVHKLVWTSELGARSLHLTSGVPLAAGSVVTLLHGGGASTIQIALSGYIPCPAPCGLSTIPAVSTIGLVIMVSGLLAAGGYVMRRRTVA